MTTFKQHHDPPATRHQGMAVATTAFQRCSRWQEALQRWFFDGFDGNEEQLGAMLNACAEEPGGMLGGCLVKKWLLVMLNKIKVGVSPVKN